MTYELSITLKVGSLEIEFDTMGELEAKLARLDVPRVERAVREAMRRKATKRNAERAPSAKPRATARKAPARRSRK